MTEPGIYPGVPYDDYNAWEATRSSDLKPFARSALHAYHAQLAQSDASHFRVGNALHTAVLEPQNFLADYAWAPKIDRRTKVGKAEWAEFQAKNADKIALTKDEYDVTQGMAQSVREHPAVAEILGSPGVNEVSLLWDDKHGRGKARLDMLRNWRGVATIGDLKSTAQDASLDAFTRTVQKFHYDMSAAWYLRGAQALAPAARQFVFVVVEKSPPYAVGVYTLSEEWLDVGAKKASAWYDAQHTATTTGERKGYEPGTLHPPEGLAREYGIDGGEW